jgi:hypothetical protein
MGFGTWSRRASICGPVADLLEEHLESKGLLAGRDHGREASRARPISLGRRRTTPFGRVRNSSIGRCRDST